MAKGSANPPALQMPHWIATYSKPEGTRKAMGASSRSSVEQRNRSLRATISDVSRRSR